jgi:hypothetical protein
MSEDSRVEPWATSVPSNIPATASTLIVISDHGVVWAQATTWLDIIETAPVPSLQAQ